MDQNIESVIDNAGFRGAEILQKIEVRPAIGAKGYQLSVVFRASAAAGLVGPLRIPATISA
jgi:hypothetical protein